MFKLNTKGLKILTTDGYRSFSGIQKLDKDCVALTTDSCSLSCSIKHHICTNKDEYTFKSAGELRVDDEIYTIYGYEKIVDHKDIGIKEVYDIVGVEGTETYFTNNILSHNCQFLSTGDSSIDEGLFYELSQKCIPPKIVLDDGHYKIWDEPDASRLYVVGVDISEGVGVDASVIQILDITDIKDIKQVAVYHNRTIPPLEFTNKLYAILRNWGSPLALIERNNCGAQVVDRIGFDMGYEKIVSYGAKEANRSRPQLGMIAHTNTKYKGIMNMRYFVNEVKTIEFRDIDTLKEMKDFVRHPNGVWRAKNNTHDDRVMSLMYALYILEKDLTDRYFDILELDSQGKPCSIEPMDFGVRMFEDPTSIYLDNSVVDSNAIGLTPIVFGMDDTTDTSDLDDLLASGWVNLG
jgi:hypothetical protein